jgi:UDP-N-acetylglucosamine 2-epimerase (non-hydrolysing)
LRDPPERGTLEQPKPGGKLSSCVALIVGTRPEAIKLAPVAAALAARGLPPAVIFTGQHPQLQPTDYGLAQYPAIRLDCPGQEDPHAHVAAASRAVAGALGRCGAELAVVQGDTSSALGGALGARLAGVAVAHVEAGLRSHDLESPWPEEEFRIAIDRDCELLFAPTELSAANLRRERVRGAIHVTGNTGIDAVLGMDGSIRACRGDGPTRLLVTCHRRENWGDGIAEIASALRHIADEGLADVELILHPNPFVAGQMRTMLHGQACVTFRQPCSHLESVAAMSSCDLILSDSGGIQEEAAALGVPLLVLRETTERPEAIASGNVELVGTDPERIITAVRRRLARKSKTSASLPFGDGRAGERIAAIIEEWLGERGEAVLSPIPSTCPRQAENCHQP